MKLALAALSGNPADDAFALGAGTGTKMPLRSMVLLGTPGASSPALTDFQAFNAAIGPRSIDAMLFMQNLDSEPPWYSSYETWASPADMGALIMTTLSPGTHSLSAFAAGTYDSSGLYSNAGLSGLAATVKAYGKPVIIRLAHEFNGRWNNSYGYTKETAAQFVAGWQHVVGTFRAAGAYNALWCWCPNVWTNSSGNAIDPTVADSSGVNWYPGDAYVDLIGLDGYMTTETASLLTPSQLFMTEYAKVCALAGKAVVIGEFGVAADSRLAGVGGKAGWYRLFFSMIADQMPRCVLVNQWQRSQPPDDYTISSSGADTAAAAAFVTGVNSPPFVPAPTGVLLRSALQNAS